MLSPAGTRLRLGRSGSGKARLLRFLRLPQLRVTEVTLAAGLGHASVASTHALITDARPEGNDIGHLDAVGSTIYQLLHLLSVSYGRKVGLFDRLTTLVSMCLLLARVLAEQQLLMRVHRRVLRQLLLLRIADYSGCLGGEIA